MNTLRPTSQRIAATIGLDPVIVVAAITALVQLVTLCREQTPAQVAASAKRPRRRQRRAMEKAVLNELRSSGTEHKFAATMRALRGEIAVMTTEQIEQICQDCQDSTSDWGD